MPNCALLSETSLRGFLTLSEKLASSYYQGLAKGYSGTRPSSSASGKVRKPYSNKAEFAKAFPSKKVKKGKNWVGGATDPFAAMQVLAQGSIPNTGIKRSGKIVSVRLEHIWIEAWIDMHPSRGSRHRTGDSWVPLDASFKQYEYIEPAIDIAKNKPFDIDTFTNTLLQNSSSNTTEGWIQGLDLGYTDTILEARRLEVKNYVISQNINAKIRDVLIMRKMIIRNNSILSVGLPHTLINKLNQYASLPDTLRHKFKFVLNYGLNNGEIFTMIKSTPELAGKKLSLSFNVATSADIDLINSLLPTIQADGSPIDLAEIPTSLPGHLINLVAEFSIGNNIILTSPNSFKMGTEVYSRTGVYSPDQGWIEKNNILIAGEYHTIALNLQEIGKPQIKDFQNKMQDTKEKIDLGNITELTHHNISGDILYSAILGFLAENDAENLRISNQSNIIQYRKVSYGSTSTAIEPQYYFGIPRNIKFSGVSIDIDHSNSILYNLFKGLKLSSHEHLALQKTFLNNKNISISAIKAIEIAIKEGQKIYELSQSNISNLSILQISDDVKRDIENAVSQGYEVLVSEKNVNTNGWTGVGYIILDPKTGSGAYKISGGSNGAFLILFGVILMFAVFLSPYWIAGITVLAGTSSTTGLLSSLFFFGFGGFLVGLSWLNDENEDDALLNETLCSIGMGSIFGSFPGIEKIFDSIRRNFIGATAIISTIIARGERLCRSGRGG